MKKSKYQEIQDYLALIIRRKWWILGTFIVCAGGAALFAVIIPDVYVSEANIIIRQQDIPSAFVTDLSTQSTDERASIIEKIILSRTNIMLVLDEFEDELTGYRGLNDQIKIAKLTKKIKIDFLRGIQGSLSSITNVLISYRDQNPELAQKITYRLNALFLEEYRKLRETQYFGTTNFLESEVEKKRKELEETGARLEVLKRRNRYQLPEEIDTNLRTLERLQQDKNSTIDALDRSIGDKRGLERQLSDTPKNIPKEQAESFSRNSQTTDPDLNAYLQKKQECKKLIATKLEDHPEVRRCKAELEEFEKDLPESVINGASEALEAGEKEGPEPEMVPNPAYQKLQIQIHEANNEIKLRQEKITRIEDEMAVYRKRVENTPKVQLDMAGVLREYEDLEKDYDDLKKKLNDAKLAQSAESQQKGTQFEQLDPANYPLMPAGPTRQVIFLAGVLVSFGLSLGVAFVIDLSNPTIVTHAELERVMETKVLIEVPRIVTPEDIRKNRYRNAIYATSFVVLTGLYAGFLYFLYLKQQKLVQILSPLIERIHG